MIQAEKLIADFRQMYEEHWRYTWGAAERGCVDCSGAFVWAYNQHGLPIAHGSNTIARKHVAGLLPISEARPGMAAFKLHRPGDKGYDLPAKFAGDADQNDYYHIGLVDESGQYVLNAQSVDAGFTRTKLSKWGCVGYLKAARYDGREEKNVQNMMVNCPMGQTVRLRKEPSGTAETILKVKAGEVVQAEDYNSVWSAVVYKGKSGYMMNEFLLPVTESLATPTDLTAQESVLLQLPFSAAILLRDKLIDALGVG